MHSDSQWLEELAQKDKKADGPEELEISLTGLGHTSDDIMSSRREGERGSIMDLGSQRKQDLSRS